MLNRFIILGLSVLAFSLALGIVIGNVPHTISYSKNPDTMESYSVLGHITLTVRDASGNIKEYQQTDNVVTQLGENCLVRHMFDIDATSKINWNYLCNSKNNFKTIAIGSGTGLVGDSNTALATEVLRGGVTSLNITSASSNVGAHAVLSKTFTGITQTISEAGLFDNNSTGGILLARQTFNGVPMTASDTITINWDIKFGP